MLGNMNSLLMTVKSWKLIWLLLDKILAFSAHQSQIKNKGIEFGGNRKVTYILSWQRGEHSRLKLQERWPAPHP